MSRLEAFAFLLLVVLTPVLSAQSTARVLTVFSSADQSQQPYIIAAPSAFEPGHTYPLVVSLHSEDSDHRLNLNQVEAAAQRGWLVVCPLARGAMGYRGIAEQDVYEVIDDVKRRYPVDEDRIFLTGISMGGGGALWLGMTRPDLWAGIAALCAGSMPGDEALAGNLSNVPVRLYQGESDPIVPAAHSRLWQKWLLEAGVPAAYFEYPQVRHNVWEVAYHGAVEDWFAGLRRNPDPEHVHFTTRLYRYPSAYWVRVDGLSSSDYGTVDAGRISPGEVRVETKNIDGFTLMRPGVESVTIDGAAVKLKPGPTASFTRTATG